MYVWQLCCLVIAVNLCFLILHIIKQRREQCIIAVTVMWSFSSLFVMTVWYIDW